MASWDGDLQEVRDEYLSLPLKSELEGVDLQASKTMSLVPEPLVLDSFKKISRYESSM